MDYIGIALGGIALVISFITLICVIRMNKRKTALSDDDMTKIRGAVSESVATLGSTTALLIAEKNQAVINSANAYNKELALSIERLKEDMSSLVKANGEYNINMIKLINDNNEKLNLAFSSFMKGFSEESTKEKNEILDKITQEMKEFNKMANETLARFDSSIKERLEDFKNSTKEALTDLNKTVSNNLKEIRDDNNEKLDKINLSVNEKLEKTLESKLKDSFENVIKQIGNVNTAIGEIKGLASDVGSLKNVLTNVKTKGIVGEVILGNIIREFLTVDQYEENIATKLGSTERVEFAIKLPGNNDESIYLPVDSKFPYEAYSKILDGGSFDEIKEARKRLRQDLLKYAKDVSDKYIDVPNTTDFGIIFLPLEGLYLEALNMGLFEEIQKKYKINITGPTTLSAFINSLQMGFKSLMIQKRSADVFKLLAAVKTEFGKFADVLSKTQRKFSEASDELDKLVGTRTRMINSKLKGIEALGDDESKALLDELEPHTR